MNVYAVLSANIEGQTELHSVWRSYDAALEEVHKLMKSKSISTTATGPECWKPHTNNNRWWFYGCDSIGIEIFKLQGHVEIER
jgi:hypothetical protein